MLQRLFSKKDRKVFMMSGMSREDIEADTLLTVMSEARNEFIVQKNQEFSRLLEREQSKLVEDVKVRSSPESGVVVSDEDNKNSEDEHFDKAGKGAIYKGAHKNHSIINLGKRFSR